MVVFSVVLLSIVWVVTVLRTDLRWHLMCVGVLFCLVAEHRVAGRMLCADRDSTLMHIAVLADLSQSIVWGFTVLAPVSIAPWGIL